MQNKSEELIKIAYRRYKSQNYGEDRAHPDEETMACFWEDKLSPAEKESLTLHITGCALCAEALALQAKILEDKEERPLPEGLVEAAKRASGIKEVFDLVLRLKERVIEILNTTADVLVGQELVPAPVLRARQMKDFKDEVHIFKDFSDIRVEIKIENKQGKFFNLTVLAKEKQTERVIKDLRIALYKDEFELESYVASFGMATFEHVLLGQYKVEIATLEKKLASVLLDIKA
jgi:hypothetical protein